MLKIESVRPIINLHAAASRKYEEKKGLLYVNFSLIMSYLIKTSLFKIRSQPDFHIYLVWN